MPLNVGALTKKEYRFYYIEKEYSNTFYEKGKNSLEYPNIGTVWIYDDKIEKSLEKPEIEEDIIEKIPILKYQEYEKVRYIIIDQTYSNSKINLQEIEVFDKETKIPYRVECTTCSSEFFAKIQNTLVDYEFNYIDNNTKIIIDLQKEYFPDNLTIKFHLGGPTGKIGKFRVTINNTKNINDVYYRYDVNEVLRVYLESKKELKTVSHEERLDNEIKEIRGVTEVENAKIIESKEEYTYKKRLYQYYKEAKHYVDGYYEDLKGLIKDEEDFQEKEEPELKPQIITEIKEKEVKIPTTITEYIEKEVIVPTTKYVKVPIITEKIEYQTKEIEVPIEKIVEKEIIKAKPKNYPFQYMIYLVSYIFLRKMSFFKG